MSKPKLAIVIGSIRPNRFAAHAAEWIEHAAKEGGLFDVQVIDLKDYPLPIDAGALGSFVSPRQGAEP
jgi:NAD(P)H-dependent FMN reductase